MQLKDFTPLLWVLAFSVACYFGHYAVLLLMDKKAYMDDFTHSLEVVYEFFGLCSLAITIILAIVRKKSIDHVGQVFLLLTCIKMGIAYAFIYSVMQENHPVSHFEKMNFFVVFALFLTLETVVSIRLLNKN